MIFRKDGTARIKLIAPGQGSSGYYPAETLKRDGPNVFKKGCQMFIDHASDAEEAARPEGSVKDLAAVFEADAAYHDTGPEGAGLYTDIRGFKAYIPLLEELGPHIGVSIRAQGKIGEALIDGKKTKVVESLIRCKSADFVTKAGAGGKFVSLLESARKEQAAQTATALKETADMAEHSATAELDQTRADQDKSLRESEAKVAKLKAEAVLRDGRDFIREKLTRERLPSPAKDKLLKEALILLPVNADGDLDKVALAEHVKQAVFAEVDYILALSGGDTPVRNMGAVTQREPKIADYENQIKESLMSMGMTEAQATAGAKVGH